MKKKVIIRELIIAYFFIWTRNSFFTQSLVDVEASGNILTLLDRKTVDTDKLDNEVYQDKQKKTLEN